MHKAENYRSVLVHPLDDSSEDIAIVKGCLQDAGFSETDQAWLVDVFKRPDCFGDSAGVSFNDEFSVDFAHILPCAVEAFREPVKAEQNQQTRLAFLFHSLLGFGRLGTAWLPNVGPQESDDSIEILGWIRQFQKHAQFCAQNLDWDQLKTLPHFDHLLPFLLPDGVPIEQIVHIDSLNPIPRTRWSSNATYGSKDLEFWLIWRFGDDTKRRNIVRLETLLPAFSRFPDAVLGNKILGLLNAIENAMRGIPPALRWDRGLDPVNDGWQVVARELLPFLELLNARNPELTQERSPLLKAWWHLSKRLYGWTNGNLASELPEDLRHRLVESASRHIGILRSVLRDTPEVFADTDVPDFYEKAFYVLLVFAPPWKRLKPLLLAFTGMQAQAVASHLGFWHEPEQENPPHPYSQIPLWIGMSMYPQHLQDALKRDTSLQGLREEFAKFCLGRLRTKEKRKDSRYRDTDFVEPRPLWRQCYVQALAALRVNPGGRAHRTLFWLFNNDPNPTVRELAKKVHKQVRHLDRRKPNLDEGASPRRPLFEAFWWLRQAHLLTLGGTVDRAGAMRTRRKELHRTREKNDRYR